MRMPWPESEALRFARVEALLDAALERPAEDRQAYVRGQTAHDPALCSEVLELLTAMEASAGFLELSPPVAVAVPPRQDRIGPWHLRRSVGQGGSGDVWLAERTDGQFDQQVAIKLLRDWRAEDIPRFLREQRMLARLDHPGIARLIDAGSTTTGQPYMVMEFIEGQPISDHARHHALDIDARLVLFLQVCEAVAYAHRHLVVHRDLKPQNILVRPDGRIALLDFGISRLIDGNTRMDATRKNRLTPQYAAPEQLAGAEETTSTDVYALGLLLYEMLAGQPPWTRLAAHGALALLQRVHEGPPPPPSSLSILEDAHRVRGDLDAIVQMATRPRAEDRYASVDALADDLARHRAGLPVRARGDAFGYRMRCMLRRHGWALAACLLLACGLLGALAAVVLAQREAGRERDAAQMEAARSKAVRDYLAHMFRDAGQQAVRGAPLTAKQVLDQAAGRVEAGFAQDPASAAEVLKALGELHFYIDDYAGAEPVLQRWLAREDAIDDPAAAADVRFTLAETLHRMGRSDEAAALLDAAQRYWATAPGRHADVLLTSRMLQSQLERHRGDTEGGIATLEAALPLRLRRSGRDHFETAALQTNLGAAYIQSGRLAEGIAASEEAMRIWRALELQHGNDALNTLNNIAAAYFRQNDFDRAERAFAEVLEIRREAFGPSAATAALIGNYARTLLKQGKAAEALQRLDGIEAMATEHAGEASPLTLSLRVTHAEALMQLDRTTEVEAELARFDDQRASAMPLPLQIRVDLLRGHLAHRQGEAEAARAALDRAANAVSALGAAGVPMHADIDALRSKIDSRVRSF